ncbi:YoaK family protein [Streptomyces violascens]|uniref:YoaK family protein n=1 Tax=Streptomyces violascens TaxID=67381 RepID=UPI003660C5EA
MITALREARTALVPDLEGRHGPLPPLLLALTLVTGLVDAFSYLVLGHVFVANMTGNVVFMAFSLAGAGGFSLTASLVSLLSFMTGALLGGRLGHRPPHHRGRLLLITTTAQLLLVTVAYLLGLNADDPGHGGMRMTLIVLLGLAMGLQNAAVRRLAVPDLTTTVLTLTVTGIAADSRPAGGPGSRAGVRALSTVTMFLGAFIGALLIKDASSEAPLLATAVILVAITTLLVPHRRSTRPWSS